MVEHITHHVVTVTHTQTYNILTAISPINQG